MFFFVETHDLLSTTSNYADTANSVARCTSYNFIWLSASLIFLWVHCNSIFINTDNCFEVCVGPNLDRICGLLLLYIHQGTLWSWSHGSWIYNYLCNQCLSQLMLWVPIPLMARFTRYNIMWLNFRITCGRYVVFSGYSFFLHQ